MFIYFNEECLFVQAFANQKERQLNSMEKRGRGGGGVGKERRRGEAEGKGTKQEGERGGKGRKSFLYLF